MGKSRVLLCGITAALMAPSPSAVDAFQQTSTMSRHPRLDRIELRSSVATEESVFVSTTTVASDSKNDVIDPVEEASESCRQSADVVNEDNSKEDLAALPTVLQGIVDQRKQFNMNLGRVMDILRRDYPDILHKPPNFSIYHHDIRVVDPSGVQLQGLKNYKASFTFVQGLIKILYHVDQSNIQVRMMYDFCRSEVRVTWNAVLQPRLGKRPLYVDGVSTYRLSLKGKVVEHRMSNLMLNQRPLSPPYGIWQILEAENILGRQMQPQGALIPAGAWGMLEFAP